MDKNIEQLCIEDDVRNVFSHITANTITKVIGLQASIWRFDPEKQAFEIIGSTKNMPAPFVSEAVLMKEDSVAGLVLETGEIQVVEDISIDARWKYKNENLGMGFKSAIIAPIKIKGKITGVLDIYFSEAGLHEPDHYINDLSIAEKKEIGEGFANQIATGIRQIEGLEKINRVNQLISSELENYDKLLENITKLAQGVLACNRVSIYIIDKKKDKLELKANSQQVMHDYFEPGEGIAGYVFKAGETLLVPDVDAYGQFIKTEKPYWKIKSIIGSPICLDNEVIGVVCADMDEVEWFDEFDKNTIETLASQAAIAIKNYDLYYKVYLRQKIFVDIGNTLGSQNFQEESEILELIFNKALSLGMKNLSIALYDDETNTVRFVLASINNRRINVVEDKEGWKSRSNGSGKTEHVIQTRKRLLLTTEELKAGKWKFTPRPGDRNYKPQKFPAAWLGVPMKVGEAVIGVIADYRYSKGFREDEISILEALAHYAAISIESLRFHKKELEKTKENLEKIWGINNLRQISWMERGLNATRSVCRVIIQDNQPSRYLKYATGFLIAPDLFMTNHHVISSIDEAQRAIVEFDYQLDSYRPLKTTRYRLNTAIFKTSKKLDYTIIGIDTRSSKVDIANWGCLDLNENACPLPGEYVNIIQHPNGGTKQIVLTANQVVKIDEVEISYTTDTMPGSSGSPVFNDLWQVVALHHAGGKFDGSLYLNSGILISAIKADAAGLWP